MSAWWERNERKVPKLDESNRAWVEELTGRIPLLLKPLSRFVNQEFDEQKFLSLPELQTVKKNITSFYRQLKRTAPEEL